jgi:hypothetical protein
VDSIILALRETFANYAVHPRMPSMHRRAGKTVTDSTCK